MNNERTAGFPDPEVGFGVSPPARATGQNDWADLPPDRSAPFVDPNVGWPAAGNSYPLARPLSTAPSWAGPPPAGRAPLGYQPPGHPTRSTSPAGLRFPPPADGLPPAGLGPGPGPRGWELPDRANRPAVAGVVAGGLALVTGWSPVLCLPAFGVAVAGLVFSAVALSRSARLGRRGLSITGLALGLAALLLCLVVSLTSAGRGGDVVSPTETSPPSPERAALPTHGVSDPTPAADHRFLSVLGSRVRVEDAELAVRTGREVCGRWADGDDLYGQVRAVRQFTRNDDWATGYLIGSATGSYCPQYTARLRVS
jgi:hypothetical protein